MFEKIMRNIEWVTIPLGGMALILSLLGHDSLAGFGLALCVLYLIYAVFLWAVRPKFDWHLINGHFLCKVCCLIMLLPFLLAVITNCIVDTPKEMAYDEILYERQDAELPCEIRNQQESPNLFWSTYFHFVDPGNQHMTTTESARIWSAIVAILGIILLNGLLVSSIIGWVDRRKEKWLKGEVKYKGFLRRNSHYIIIGGNDMVAGLVKQILKKGQYKKYILIQTSSDIEKFRRELFSALTEEEQKLIILYYGSRTSEKDIEELCVESAEEVYVVGEETRTDDIESYHDTMNMECLKLLLSQYKESQSGKAITGLLPRVEALKKELAEAKDNDEKMSIRERPECKALDAEWAGRKRLNCRVMFEYQTTFSVFQFFDIDERMDAYINFVPFNYYEMWAQKVLINRQLDKKQLEDSFKNGGYLPLEGASGIKRDDDNYVHLFVVGMSRMGVSMAIEAAHLAHYPNYEEKKIRTKITFIDKKAFEERAFFMGRFKELFALSHWRYGDVGEGKLEWRETYSPSDFDYLGGDFIDIEWEFIEGGIESSVIQNYILASANPMAKISIAVCLPESNRSHAAALYLDKRIYESDSVQQVLVFNRYGNSIVDAISSGNSTHPYKGKLRCIGGAVDCIVVDYLEMSETVGQFINKAYMGDKKQYAVCEEKYAGKSKVANRWSSIYNGNALWTKLRSIDFNAGTFADNKEDIAMLANVEHNRWNVEELLMNFRYLETEEQRAVLNGEKTKKELKAQMAHLDICSNKRLLEIDSGVRKYDVELTECLPRICEQLQVIFPNE